MIKIDPKYDVTALTNLGTQIFRIYDLIGPISQVV